MLKGNPKIINIDTYITIMSIQMITMYKIQFICVTFKVYYVYKNILGFVEIGGDNSDQK